MNNEIKKWIEAKNEDKIMTKSLESTKNINFDIEPAFGTAGMRGIMSAGPANINPITIASATRAFALFILEKDPSSIKKGIVIANDNRNNGTLYKETVGKILNEYGIKYYVLDNNEIMSTPLLSFMIREIGAFGGINITASHNPKEYNGFKVYNYLGGQMTEESTNIISNNMKNNDLFQKVIGNYSPTLIEPSLVEKYINNINKNNSKFSNIKVSYSPLHGTGSPLAEKIFKNLGVEFELHKKEMTIDGDFKNTKFVNPEDPRSYKGVLKLARKSKSDLGIITDPDADRFGVISKYKKR